MKSSYHRGLNYFTLLFTQYNSQEPRKIEVCGMGLLHEANGCPRHEDFKTVVIVDPIGSLILRLLLDKRDQ